MFEMNKLPTYKDLNKKKQEAIVLKKCRLLINTKYLTALYFNLD